LRETLYDTDHEAAGLGTFAAFLFVHNSRVGMLCVALGFVAGVPTILLLVITGLMLGAFLALFASRGLGLDFVAWIAPHGVTELLAAVICAAAGLHVAQALLFPTRRSRLESMAHAGRRAGIVVLGGLFMFLVAGGIEGVFRQTVTALHVRLGLAAATAVAWTLYFVRAPRRRGVS
jgi:uncharacterized membrane protein SpoIIM required for sporulation